MVKTVRNGKKNKFSADLDVQGRLGPLHPSRRQARRLTSRTPQLLIPLAPCDLPTPCVAAEAHYRSDELFFFFFFLFFFFSFLTLFFFFFFFCCCCCCCCCCLFSCSLQHFARSDELSRFCSSTSDALQRRDSRRPALPPPYVVDVIRVRIKGTCRKD